MEGKESPSDQSRSKAESKDSPLKKALKRAGGRHVSAGLRQAEKGLIRKITAAIVTETPDDLPEKVTSTASSLSPEKKEGEQGNLSE